MQRKPRCNRCNTVENNLIRALLSQTQFPMYGLLIPRHYIWFLTLKCIFTVCQLLLCTTKSKESNNYEKMYKQGIVKRFLGQV